MDSDNFWMWLSIFLGLGSLIFCGVYIALGMAVFSAIFGFYAGIHSMLVLFYWHERKDSTNG